MNVRQRWKNVRYEAEVDPKFVEEIASIPAGQRLFDCIQCGTCSGTCPVSHYMDQTPRKIIAMIRAGFRQEVLASVTGEDEDNLVVCQLAKEKFKVSRTVARVNDPKNEPVFSCLGADVPIDATAILAKIIEEEVSFADFVNLMSFKRGKLAIVRVDLPPDSPVINKQLQELQLPPDSVLVSIIRGDQVIVPKGNTTLLIGDDLIALTLLQNEQQLLNYLIGKL